MGDNKVSDGSDSAKSQITNYRLVDGGEAEVAEKGKSDVRGKDQYFGNALHISPLRKSRTRGTGSRSSLGRQIW